jgi:perosamine synthetase
MRFSHVIEKIQEIFGASDVIPLHAPIFNGNEKKYLNHCIDTTFVSSVGEYVDRFEEEMAQYVKSIHAIVCVNGTNALQIALQLVGVERDNEVITQPLTFIATANAISYCGAHPVFVDVDISTLGMSPESLRSWLSQNVKVQNNQSINLKTGRKISAIVPMHTFGHPCRIDEIIEIGHEFNIPVVEDTAESVGSTFKGKHCGTFARIGIQSFNGNKIITTGGGGMILTDDDELARKAKHITTQAKMPHKWDYVHDEIGYNFRMPNINAALGVAQLEQLDKFISAKRKLAIAYKAFFNSVNIQFISEPEYARSNYWLNAIILSDRQERDLFLEETNNNGVMTRPVWRLMNKLPMFKNSQIGDLSNAEWLEDRVVNLPSSVTQI